MGPIENFFQKLSIVILMYTPLLYLTEQLVPKLGHDVTGFSILMACLTGVIYGLVTELTFRLLKLHSK